MLAEEIENFAPAIHGLLGSVQWPVSVKNAMAGIVIAVELMVLAVLL